MAKIVGVLFPVDGSPRRVEFDNELEPLQAMVAGGGYVQALYVDGMTVWIDEDGKAKELPHNITGQGAYILHGGRLFAGDYLAGPVLFTGRIDAKGATLGLTDKQVRTLTVG